MRLYGAAGALLGLGQEEGTRFEGGRAEWLAKLEPADAAEAAKMDAAAAEGTPRSLDYPYLRPDGITLWLRDTQCLIRDPATGGAVLAGSLTDLTPTRQMAAQLRHYQKTRVFGELAGGVAHDFNNLLALFHGYSELLQMEAQPDTPGAEYLREMIAAVERARELTSQLHRFGHFKRESPGRADLLKVARDCRRLLRRLVEERIELVFEEKTEAAWTRADPQELETVLLNLAINACDAMPGGGRLEMEVDCVRAGKKKFCSLTVRDTGEGIRKADLGHIFEPGFTTRRSAGAEGAGLGVCKEIAEAHGGSITVQSARGKGTEVRVLLPALAIPEVPSPVAHEKIPMGRGEEILIAEDASSVCNALSQMVMRLGYKARCAANGEEARRILEREPKIRLVITDLVMPLMSGEELAEIIQSRWPGIPVILISGYGSSLLPEKTNPTKSRLFLPKPVALGCLARHIRQLIDV